MKDIQGREWLFRFTVLTVRDIAAETQLDTKAIEGENSLLQRVAKDESTLYKVMWITIRPQAQSMGVTEDAWLSSLDNESLQVGAQEWCQAYINFSQPARRTVLSKVLANVLRKTEAANAAVEAAIASGEIDRVIEMAMAQPKGTLPPSGLGPISMTIAAS
jgi:hypothetical protein